MKKIRIVVCAVLLICAVLTHSGLAQIQNNASKKTSNATPQAITTQAGGSSPVTGSGTPDRLVKWTGSSSTSYTVGDSIITEDKLGKVGIGTPTPTSKLTVQGMIETTLGGYKFPDGTIQTTAGLSTLFHDTTLQGNGTAALPLGLAVPLQLTGSTLGIKGVVSVFNSSNGIGVNGISNEGYGVNGQSHGSNDVLSAGVRGVSENATGVHGFSINRIGVYGASLNFTGVLGSSNTGIGVHGMLGNPLPVPGTAAVLGNAEGNNVGVAGFSDDSNGVIGVTNTGNGITGVGNAGLAGSFIGDVEVTGSLAKGGGSFKIDHPLDPANKYLYHSFVESPDMMNIYNGNITTDENGDAVITMPDYFEALNREFRYQLTVIGTFAQVIVASEIKGNRFAIKTNAPSVKVSWQVTGVRQDAWANKNRIPVEVEKEKQERGYYLHFEAHEQSEEKSIEWARNPKMMQQLKEVKEQKKQAKQNINHR
jgi:hypothetical protein